MAQYYLQPYMEVSSRCHAPNNIWMTKEAGWG